VPPVAERRPNGLSRHVLRAVRELCAIHVIFVFDEGHAPKNAARLTPERFVPFLHFENGLIEVIVAQWT